MTQVVFVIVFGLLPLWLALGYSAFAIATMPSDYAAMTLWAVVPAIPACAITLLIALIATAIHARTSGTSTRKLVFAGGFLVLSCLALAAFVVRDRLETRDRERVIQGESNRASQFAREHPEVRKAVGEPITADVGEHRDRSGPLPHRYQVAVEGARKVYVLVEVDRTTSPVSFRLLCTSAQPGTAQCL